MDGSTTRIGRTQSLKQSLGESLAMLLHMPTVEESPSSCSYPGCDGRGTIMPSMEWCPRCATARAQTSILSHYGPKFTEPLYHPERIRRDHPAFWQAGEAWRKLCKHKPAKPVGGVWYRGVTGSGKTTAVVAFLGCVVRDWPRLSMTIWPQASVLAERLVMDRVVTMDLLMSRDIVVIGDIRKIGFTSDGSRTHIRNALHDVADRAYNGTALVVVDSELGKSARGEGGQKEIRGIEEVVDSGTYRRLISSFVPGQYQETCFTKDLGCPWGEEPTP